MTKKAFLFPGQGCQTVGMGEALYKEYPMVKKAFDTAEAVTGKDIAALCFQGPEDELSQTVNAQIAIFTLSMGIFLELKEGGILPDMVAGFSLGEYSALCAAGVFSLEDGIRIVAKRGELMQKASVDHPGSMAAIIGLTNEQVEAICKEAADFVCPVNYNCPKQLVISGTVKGIEVATAASLAKGAMKAVPLNTSGPFHTELIADAAAEMKNYLSNFTFHAPNYPVYTNLTGALLGQDTDIPTHLETHMTHPVQWQTTIEAMLAAGASTFAEVGPGRTLAGFNRRIERSSKTYTLEALEQLQDFITYCRG